MKSALVSVLPSPLTARTWTLNDVRTVTAGRPEIRWGLTTVISR